MIKKIYDLIIKYIMLFIIGGLIYTTLEIIFRGYTHWAMGVVGGFCFILLGLINEMLPWSTPLALQMLIGSIIITFIEFVSGCILNIWLKLNIWDYSNLPFNILGQICLPFSILWYFISAIGIVIDDYIRYIYFDEEYPRYKLF